MARPKKLTAPERLNLLINGSSKKRAVKLAFKRNISVGQLLENLVTAEIEREGAASK